MFENCVIHGYSIAWSKLSLSRGMYALKAEAEDVITTALGHIVASIICVLFLACHLLIRDYIYLTCVFKLFLFVWASDISHTYMYIHYTNSESMDVH